MPHSEQNTHSDLRVLITGASKGIGRSCAEDLASRGALVTAVARSPKALQELAKQYPDRIEPWCIDATSKEFFNQLKEIPELDVLVNNLGTNVPEPLEQVSIETLDHMIDINIKSVFRCSQIASQIMQRAKPGGSIIHMSSQMGHVGAPNRTVYCMSKHAVEGLTKAMAVELAPKNIRVNSVAPTFVETPLTSPMFEEPEFQQYVMSRIPIGRLCTPANVAHAVAFLASPESSMITGTCLKVDGGWTAQ